MTVNIEKRPWQSKFAILVLPGIFLAVLCLSPFLNKAYTIDDPAFLLEARQILQTPLEPWSYPICWNGDGTCLAHAGNLGANDREGLMGYVLVPVILAHGAEWLAHLIQIFLAWVAVWAMVRLALRLNLSRIEAAITGMLLVAIPTFLSMASTAMPDTLSLALGLTGIERLAAWKEERRWRQGVAAALALGLAPYARPHVALYLPLGALWLMDSFDVRKALAQLRRDWKLWAPVAGAAAVLFTVIFLTRQRDAEPKDMLISARHVPWNLIAYCHYLAFPIPLAAVWLAANWRRAKTLVLLPILLALMLFIVLASPLKFVTGLQTVAVFGGLFTLIELTKFEVKAYFATGDRTGILLLLWTLMPLTALVYMHLPLKYLVAVLPAIVLIIVRTLNKVTPARALAAYAAILVICVSYSVILLRADKDFAEYGRRAAAELIAPRVAAGERVWFSGQWGLYWYAQEAGAKVSQPGESGPKPGELLVVGVIEGGEAELKRFPDRELIDWRSYDSPHGRTMDYSAGLYTNLKGLLPWRWNPKAANVYEVWRIR
jgi:hypothetical protein